RATSGWTSASTRTFRRSRRRWTSTARPSARSSTRTWTTLSTTIPVRATTPPRRRPRGARPSRGSANIWRREIHDARQTGQAEGRNMALSNECKGFACGHSSCGGAPRHPVDFGRRDFLIDGHTPFIRGGLTYTNEVRWDGVPSLAEGLRRVREQAQRTPAPHWVQVIGGWTWAQFAEQRHPTLEEINAATGDTPCMIMHLYDRAWLNRAGIRALGWTKDTPNMFG